MFSSRRRPTSEPQPVNSWQRFEAEAMPHMDSLFRIAMWRVRDRATAEDLVQETMTEALKSFHRFEPGTNAHAWLVTIMSHTDSKRRRKLARLEVVGDADERIAETVAYQPPTPEGLTDEEVLGALSRIPTNYSQVVMLADVEEFSYKEIANALQVPIGTVMSRLNRGRKLLRAELAEYAGACGIKRQQEMQ
ncbi:MAG: sigma-70 family RNA polymerase sigma factor [Acidobacteriota bacterium]|nr:sigma-70 family RNA polymerase sigma factor [Acidobacteriota bacterium]